jgi:hypothetical protein
MLRKQQPRAVERGIDTLQLVDQPLLLEQLLAEPYRHGLQIRAEPARSECEIGLQQALEFQERLVVEDHVVGVTQPHSCFAETVSDRVPWKALVEFPAREALFLGGGRDPPVLYQRRRAVVVERRKSENPHVSPLNACVRS